MGSWKKIRKAVTKPFQIKKDLFRKVAGKALGSSGGSGDERSEADHPEDDRQTDESSRQKIRRIAVEP